MKKFFKCTLWFVKEYANVGIALALFMLTGLQIEKQYRSERYFGNCIEDTNWKKGVKYHSKVESCTEAKSYEASAFNYHRGIISKYSKD